jgi:SAM-dependent methyltransferase
MTRSRKELNDGYFARHCPGCDLLITDADASRECLERTNRERYAADGRLQTHYLRRGEFSRRYRDILALIRRHSGGGVRSMLEIGSNIGVFAGYAAEQGIAVETVEINDDLRALQEILHKVPAYKSISDVPEGRSYDAIVMMDVLEHIPGPVEYLGGLKEYLKDDGVVFLQMPNKNSWSSRIAGKRWGWWSAPDHLYHFSGRALLRAAERAGYRAILLRFVSPVLDDLEGIPVLGRIFSPARFLSRWVNPNPFLAIPGGSLILAILKVRQMDGT